MSKDTKDSLFEIEQKVLQNALTDIADTAYEENELLPRYKILTAQYKKLLRLCQKIFRISDSQGLLLQHQQSEMQILLDNAEQGFLTFGADLKVNQQYSQECVRIFNRKITGCSVVELLEQGEIGYAEKMAAHLQEVFTLPINEANGLLAQLSAVISIGDKKVRVAYKMITRVGDTMEIGLVMMILTDITEKLKADAQIHYLSFHDKLTGLYNRAYLETVIAEMGQPACLPLSVIVLDMNGLKVINDMFGHGQGDRHLILLAEVLRQACSGAEVICRWGGDEFVVLLPRTTAAECAAMCERITQLCRDTKDTLISLRTSLGTATIETPKTSLSEVFTIAENRMYSNKVLEGRRSRQEIIESLQRILKEQCFESEEHNERILALAEDFIQYLGTPLEAGLADSLRQLVVLHDVGKATIGKEVLGKKACLTATEWRVIQGHSEAGYRMAQAIGEPALADLILALHERWDGQGYPYGLQGEAIPWLARVFSLVETYEVLTHERPYGEVMSEAAALEEIKNSSAKQLDPGLVEEFILFMKGRGEAQCNNLV